MKIRKILTMMLVVFLTACVSTKPTSYLPSVMKKASVELENRSDVTFTGAMMQVKTDGVKRSSKGNEGDYGKGKTMTFLLMEEEDGIKDAKEIVLSITLQTKTTEYFLGEITIPGSERGITYHYYIDNVVGDSEKIALSNGESSIEIAPSVTNSAGSSSTVSKPEGTPAVTMSGGEKAELSWNDLEGFWNAAEDAEYITIMQDGSGEYIVIYDDWFEPANVRYTPVDMKELGSGVYAVQVKGNNGSTKTLNIDLSMKEQGRLIVNSKTYEYQGNVSSSAMTANQNRATDGLFTQIGGYWTSTEDNTFYGFLTDESGGHTVGFGHYATSHYQEGYPTEIFEYANGIRMLVVHFPEIPAVGTYGGLAEMDVYLSLDVSTTYMGKMLIDGVQYQYAGADYDSVSDIFAGW